MPTRGAEARPNHAASGRVGLVLAGTVLVGAAAICLMATSAEASHFRAGTIQWDYVASLPQIPPWPVPLPDPIPSQPPQLPNFVPTVNLTMVVAFRGNYPTFPPFPQAIGTNLGAQGAILWGDSSSTATYDVIVTSVDVPANTVYTKFVESGTGNDLTHQYPAGSTGTFIVSWASSARISWSSGHVNNADEAWRLEAVVNLQGSNHSPVATLVPVQPCPQSGTCTFQILASDPDNDPLNFRLSTSPEATGGMGFYQPGPCPPGSGSPGCGFVCTPAPCVPIASASINPTTGLVTWVTTGATLTTPFTYYSMQIMVEDPTSRIPLDYLIRLDPPQPPPTCNPATQTIQQGNSASFTSTGNGNSWSSTGANPPSSTGSNYNPQYQQAGTYTVTVSNSGGSATCQVIVLPPPPPPVCLPTTQTIQNLATATFSSVGTGNMWTNPGGMTTSGTGNTFSSQYTSPGTFYANVTNSSGWSLCEVIVLPNPPTAMFTATPVVDCQREFPVAFVDSSTPGDGTITNWDWDFGEAQASGQNQQYTYESEGNQSATLTVTNSYGLTASYTVAFWVGAVGCPDPSMDPQGSPRPAGPPRDGSDGFAAGLDSDGDGVPDGADVCPFVADAAQSDLDRDGLGDLCDADMDGDTFSNGSDACPAVPDTQADLDRDGMGDACDQDRDGDAVANGEDACPDVADPAQADADGDGFGDACDPEALAGAVQGAAAPAAAREASLQGVATIAQAPASTGLFAGAAMALVAAGAVTGLVAWRRARRA